MPLIRKGVAMAKKKFPLVLVKLVRKLKQATERQKLEKRLLNQHRKITNAFPFLMPHEEESFEEARFDSAECDGETISLNELMSDAAINNFSQLLQKYHALYLDLLTLLSKLDDKSKSKKRFKVARQILLVNDERRPLLKQLKKLQGKR